VTRFIGRRRELNAVTSAIASHRLVTLRGVGGVGKTRLALRVAQLELGSHADGCWLVELSALRDATMLVRTISATLGLPDESSGDPVRVLAGHLAHREMLLVLDTCEHVIDACAQLAAVLLEAVPGLRILATSREPLGVADEQVLLIPPLETPADVPPGPDGGRAADNSDAVALFVDRAQAAVEGFALTPDNAGAVVQLCQRLDGIPLALELAAVRLRSMPLQEILARLDDRFRILGPTRTNTDRHRTLRSAVSWSYVLCTADEQRLWAQLSVFPGGFDRAGAEYVCGPDAFDLLLRLVEKSIVQYDERTRRYRLLDTMREFGAGQLTGLEDRAGLDNAGGLRARHRDYYLALVTEAAGKTISSEQLCWLTRLRAETDNIWVALGWSLETPGQEATGLRMTVLLRSYWLMTGMFAEGRGWHEKALSQCPGTHDHAWAAYGAGVLRTQQGDLAGAAPLLGEAAALAARLGDADLATLVTDAQAIASFYAGDLEAARAGHESSLAVYERSGFPDALALSTYARLASVCLLSGEIGRATDLCEEYLRRCEETGEQWGRGTALWTHGACRWLAGDLRGAVDDTLECLRIKESLGDLHTMTMCLDLLAVCYAGLGEFDRAAVLYGAGDTNWAILDAPVQMGPGYTSVRNSAADTARENLGEDRYTVAYRRGTGLSLAAAIAVARGGETALGDQGVRAKPLTRREKEIAGLVAGGLANREIAERLFLSKRTVDSHLEHIFTKLGFSSRMQLANWVLGQAAR
jgi:non-specific serine/threonine protein kinase